MQSTYSLRVFRNDLQPSQQTSSGSVAPANIQNEPSQTNPHANHHHGNNNGVNNNVDNRAASTTTHVSSKKVPRFKGFQDPCHPTQSLYYSPLAVQFIDTPEFQRLRRLKQLGTADTVFPGGVHTRFQHCLGTYFFAKQQMIILREKQPELLLNSRDVEIVALAGLSHDLGHGPFSHAFETFIESAGVHFEHEEMSAKLVGRIVKSKQLLMDDAALEQWSDCSVHDAPPGLSARDVLLIRCMIATSERTKHAALIRDALPPAKAFMMDIVCNSRNSIDVDKFDYLIRDAYFCGSSVRPSPHRLMDNCRVIGGVLCYRKKVLHAIYQLFNVRSNNFREIYGHRVSKAIEFMIMDALQLVDAKLGISVSAADPSKFIRLDDSIVSVVRFRATEPANAGDPAFRAALDLIERIERRDVYKAVFESLFRNERATNQRIKASEMIPSLVQRVEQSLGANRISANDIRVQILKLNFAMGEKDPLKLVEIYDSESDTVPRRPTQSDIGHLVPIIHDELLVRVFCTQPNDEELCVALKRAARDYVGSLSLPPTPAATPMKSPHPRRNAPGYRENRDTSSLPEPQSTADPHDASEPQQESLTLGRRKRDAASINQAIVDAVGDNDDVHANDNDDADLRQIMAQMQSAINSAMRLIDNKRVTGAVVATTASAPTNGTKDEVQVTAATTADRRPKRSRK